METLITILIILIALFHVYAFVMETFLWKTPRAMEIFGTNPETAASFHAFAINQGVYNLFLVAGLVWALLAPDPVGFQTKIFFLSCIVVAGITAGITGGKRIMIMQGVPALMTLILVMVFL